MLMIPIMLGQLSALSCWRSVIAIQVIECGGIHDHARHKNVDAADDDDGGGGRDDDDDEDEDDHENGDWCCWQ